MIKRTVADIYAWLYHHAPIPLRKLIKLLMPQRLRLSLSQHMSDEPWLLHGRLEGHRMFFRTEPERQYIINDYEPQVCSVIERTVKPGWVCVDLGAHIGYMTLLMAKLTGEQGHVYAFEALPDNALTLGQNIAVNGYEQRVTVENTAASDGAQKELQLYRGPSTFESTIVERGWDILAVVPAVALDEYFSKGPGINFIKIDIEGGEALAVRGMQKILKEMRPVLLVEIHNGVLSLGRDLQALGYTFYDLEMRALDVDSIAPDRIHQCVAAPAENPLSR